MPLSAGSRIGIYEVVAQLGAGGMGEVYRARDTKLDREVALKVLPQLFSGDPERLARFEREAKVLASLNHPNIAQVYGFEASAIAMELVEGPTLDEIIREGMTLNAALPVLRQIAAALEVAHDQGIIHRDLKPANVKVREDGTVKVLDFGLAKALANDGDGGASSVSNSPTLTARSTQLGMILGTAAYMAPEQAKGRAVDRRADVWAFGVVFFEMLAGRRAFEGDDVSDVLASVLKSEPNWSALPADLPEPVRRFLRRCLEKDPKKRLRDIGEGVLQLEEGLAGGSMSVSASGTVAFAPAPTPPFWRRALPVAAAVVLTAGAVAGGMRWLTPEPARPEPVQFQYTPPMRLFFTVLQNDLAISPNGRLIAYTVTDNQRPPALHLRRLDQADGAPLRGGENACLPFFSPDDGWVGFIDQINQSNLKKVSVLGGPPVQIATANSMVLGATWLEGGTIVFGSRGGSLYRVADAGGTPQALTSLEDKDQEHLWPSGVPGTSLVLFTINPQGTTPAAGGELAAVDVTTGRITRFKLPGAHPRYVSSGRIVYASADGSLRAVPFDAGRVAITGDPIPVVEGVGIKASGASNFDISRNGHLLHTTGGVGANALRTLVWTDRAGRETPIAAEKRNYFYARIAPGGGRLSLDIRDQELDIWIWDLTRETLSRLTDTPGSDSYGLWMPDGRVVFASTGAAANGRQEVYYHRVDGVGEMQQITDTAAGKLQPFPNGVTPDGKQVVFRAAAAGGKNDLYIAPIGGDKSYKPLLATEHDEYNADFSPDGRFFVFISDLSGKPEIYVRPFPDVNSGQWPVSTAGGTEPVWSKAGREIFYLAPDGKLMAVPVDTTKGVTLGKPQALFDASPYFFGAVGRNYDVSADGKRFIMVKDIRTSGETRANPLTIVLNWVERLKSK